MTNVPPAASDPVAVSTSISAQELLDAFLRNVPDSVYFKDVDSRFIAASECLAGKIRASGAHELIGKTDHDFFARSHADAARADELEIMRSEKNLENKLEREAAPDGSDTWCVTTKLPLRDAGGRIVGTFGISRDVTESRHLQEQLDIANREVMDASRRAGMTDVATGVLHNVGNVLNSVNVAGDVLTEGLSKLRIEGVARLATLLAENAADLPGFFATPKGAQVPGYVAQLASHLSQERARLMAEAAELRKYIDHIKEVVAMQQSFATAGGVTETLDPCELVEDSLRLNLSALQRHDIGMVRDFVSAPPIEADRNRVLLVLVNLIRNAKHALDDGPESGKRIVLRIESDEKLVRFVVTDNGVGIPAENLERIFSHGFTTRKTGHGFGLHSCAIAAGEMGGRVWAASEGPGHGSVFTLELPRAPEGAAVAKRVLSDEATRLLARSAGLV